MAKSRKANGWHNRPGTIGYRDLQRAGYLINSLTMKRSGELFDRKKWQSAVNAAEDENESTHRTPQLPWMLQISQICLWNPRGIPGKELADTTEATVKGRAKNRIYFKV